MEIDLSILLVVLAAPRLGLLQRRDGHATRLFATERDERTPDAIRDGVLRRADQLGRDSPTAYQTQVEQASTLRTLAGWRQPRDAYGLTHDDVRETQTAFPGRSCGQPFAPGGDQGGAREARQRRA